MKLCFGTFANVLLRCGIERLHKKDLLNAIVQSVDGACDLTSNAVTGLLNCTTNLPNGRSNSLGNVVSNAAKADPKVVANHFVLKVVPLITTDMHKLVVIVLREIIVQDGSIHDGAVVEMVSGATKKALREQSSFVLADFLAGVFLYSATVNNRIGKEILEFVTDDFMLSFTGLEKNIFLLEPNEAMFVSSREVEYNPDSKKVPADNECVPNDTCLEYLSSMEEAYGEVKTLLYLNQPKPFYSLYVPNYVIQFFGRYNYNTVKNITAKTITDISNFIILDGMGGVGKTMMMRHLLLNAISEYENSGIVPIFISLKDYDGSELFDFIHKEIAIFNEAFTETMLKDGLAENMFLLLLDGLDEIADCHSQHFEKQLRVFADKYSKNRYVISSRSYSSYMSFSRFTVLKIEPFTQEQALDFIDMIEFRPEEPEFKGRFRDLLASSLYKTHRSFIENPLLLTILLLTFEKFASVPTQMHLFYKKAFVTLSETHDASKSSYKRVYKSGMIAEKIADYFAEFCFHSYKDSKYEFTDEEFERYYGSMRINDKSATAASFAYDLCANLCLMFYEGKYQFTHRSFQEYFCAVFFSNQDEAILERLGDFLENNKQRMRGDQTFNMLYDMIPHKVKAKIFIPFLENLFDKCDEEDGYWTYLASVHPYIQYSKGEMHDYPANPPESYLIGFMLELIKPKFELTWDDLPGHDDFLVKKYGYVQTDEDVHELVNLENVHEEYEWLSETPEAAGWGYAFEVAEVYRNDRFYDDVRLVLSDDKFVFKCEYNALRNYFEDIKAEKQSNFDFFADLL